MLNIEYRIIEHRTWNVLCKTLNKDSTSPLFSTQPILFSLLLFDTVAGEGIQSLYRIFCI